MSEKSIDALAIIAGTTYQSVNAQAVIIQIHEQEVISSAVIITGEPNVKLFMVI